MKHRIITLVLTGGAALLAAYIQADEGMWLPEQLPELAETLQQRGLEIDPARLASVTEAPLAAVVSLGDCTASFVSPDGLVVTNYHCVEEALQYNSSAERNLVIDGFYAATLEEELWAGPGSRVYVTESISDVTERVAGSVGEGLSDVERFLAIDRVRKQIVSECEATPQVHCQVKAYFGGLEYRLIRQLEIEDVRLVYAPPRSMGDYGGEIDNWMWPRHAAEFAFYRAYIGPDGAPASHSDRNRPYHPPHFLRIAAQGLGPGDMVLVAGYPWQTYRYRSAREMAHVIEVTGPWEMEVMTDLLEILTEVMEADVEASIRLNPLRQNLLNYLKYDQGLLSGFAQTGVYQQVSATETQLVEWLDGLGEQGETWQRDLEELNAQLEQSWLEENRDSVLDWMSWSVILLGAANTIYWLAVEREKPDLERTAGYQERDWPDIRERMEEIDSSFDETADRRILAYFLEAIANLPEGQRIAAIDDRLNPSDGPSRAVEEVVAEWYDLTGIDSLEQRLALLEVTRAELDASPDPFLRLAAALYPLRRQAHDDQERLQGALSRLRPSYIAALRELRPGPIYPDANGTLRVTFGTVRGYDPRDAVTYRPFTTLSGIREKHTGEEPFNAPGVLLEAIGEGSYGPYLDPRLASVPVNFLSNVDTTGGNSGSPTLNARGELVGLLFDGNWESLPSEWLFNPTNTRSIHVDVRYMLWVMDRVHQAHRLLEEMGVPPVFEP